MHGPLMLYSYLDPDVRQLPFQLLHTLLALRLFMPRWEGLVAFGFRGFALGRRWVDSIL